MAAAVMPGPRHPIPAGHGAEGAGPRSQSPRARRPGCGFENSAGEQGGRKTEAGRGRAGDPMGTSGRPTGTPLPPQAPSGARRPSPPTHTQRSLQMASPCGLLPPADIPRGCSHYHPHFPKREGEEQRGQAAGIGAQRVRRLRPHPRRDLRPLPQSEEFTRFKGSLRGQGGEMTQVLYAHMNNKIIKKIKK
jgi:hypothetical protein